MKNIITNLEIQLLSKVFHLMVLFTFCTISQMSFAQDLSASPIVRKHKVGIVSSVLNTDRMLGVYTEFGLSHEGYVGGNVGLATHATYLVNNIVSGIVVRPEIRFYLQKLKEVNTGFYISLGASFSYIAGNGFPGADEKGYVNLYRLSLGTGVGYQYIFKNGLFLNASGITGIGIGIYKIDGTSTPADLWNNENKSHPLFSPLTALIRVGYAF